LIANQIYPKKQIMSILSDTLTNTKDVIITVPKTTGSLSSICITIGDVTVRAGSRAFMKHGLKTPVFVPTTIPNSKASVEKVFAKKNGKGTGYALSAIVACTKALITKTQAIEDSSCGGKKR